MSVRGLMHCVVTMNISFLPRLGIQMSPVGNKKKKEAKNVDKIN